MTKENSPKTVDTDGNQRFRQLLVEIGSNRDESAFAEIYDYFSGRVKSFLLGKGTAETTAEDLMQEVMLTIWRRAESYDPTKAAASTWIFTIARNRRIDHLRGNRRVEVDLDDELLDISDDEEKNQEQLTFDAQSANLLKHAIDQLPQAQRQVVHLSFYTGKSHGAIAEWLDLPIGTVKSRIRLAMQNVRGYLENEGTEI